MSVFTYQPQLIKWLEDNHLISAFELTDHIKIDTLFVDNNTLDHHIDLENYSTYKKEFINDIKNQLKDIIAIFDPQDTFFYSIDGVLPVSRYQTLRIKKLNKAYRKKMNFKFSFPDEEFYKQKMTNCNTDDFDNAIKEYFSELKNKEGNKIKKFIFSCEFTPGESSQKFFDYFSKWKSSRDYTRGKNHFIYSNNLDNILYALKFINEKFFIIYPNYVKDQLNYQIINVSNLRHFFIQKAKGTRTVDESRIIDDLIGLMLIVDNGFIGKLKLFGKNDVKYSDIFKAYFILNENLTKPYQFLIENDVFKVYVLKNIAGIMSKNIKEQIKIEENRRKEEKTEALKKKYGSVPKKPTLVLGSGTTFNDDIEYRPFVQHQIKSVNELLPVSPPNLKTATNDQNQNAVLQNQIQNMGPQIPMQTYTQYPQNRNYFPPQHVIYNSANPPTQQEKSKYTPKIERRNKDEGIQISINDKEQSQELLRLFNYAFIYYTEGPPCKHFIILIITCLIWQALLNQWSKKVEISLMI